MTSGPGRNGQPSKISRGHIAALRLAPVILSLLLLAHPAASQTDEAEKLGPLDTIELSVTGWSALRGGAAEAALLNNSFTASTPVHARAADHRQGSSRRIDRGRSRQADCRTAAGT